MHAVPMRGEYDDEGLLKAVLHKMSQRRGLNARGIAHGMGVDIDRVVKAIQQLYKEERIDLVFEERITTEEGRDFPWWCETMWDLV